MRELWQWRELVTHYGGRDLKLRYRQARLGVVWAILQPIMMTLVFAIAFSRFGVTVGDVPYDVFVLAGLVPWFLFAQSVSACSESLVGNSATLSKVYFPRIIMPIASLIVPLADAVASFLMLGGLMIVHHVGMSSQAIFLPVFGLALIATSLGVGLWLAALNVRHRDVRAILPFVLQAGLLLSPIAFPVSLAFRGANLLAFNPLAPVIQGIRWALLGTTAPSGLALTFCFGFAAAALISGALYFQRAQRDFLDVV